MAINRTLSSIRKQIENGKSFFQHYFGKKETQTTESTQPISPLTKLRLAQIALT